MISHICMYLDNGECLLNISFRCLTSKGWSDSFGDLLIVTKLAKALRPAPKPLYKQPSLCILCINLSTFSLLVIQGLSFCESVWHFHSLSTESHIDLADVRMFGYRSCGCSDVRISILRMFGCSDIDLSSSSSSNLYL